MLKENTTPLGAYKSPFRLNYFLFPVLNTIPHPVPWDITHPL